MSETLRGTVKWFNDAKGFGFIEHESGRDVFVHYSVIQSEGFKTLKDGEIVEYEIKEGPKGLHALKVVRTVVPDTEKQEGSSAEINGSVVIGENGGSDAAASAEPSSAGASDDGASDAAEYEHSAG